MSHRALLLTTVVTLLLAGAAPAATSDYLAFTYTAPDGDIIPYRLFVPLNYDPNKQYPLFLCLHNAGLRGTDNVIQLYDAAAFLTRAKTPQYESFILAPQTDEWWNGPEMESAIAIMNIVCESYSVDRTRLMVGGTSMGGVGTWEAMLQQPKLFAACVPSASTAPNYTEAYILTGQNLWAFQGEFDEAFGVDSVREIISAIRANGGDPLYTEYAGAGHGIWGMVMNTPELYDWMFAQRGEGAMVDSIPPALGPHLTYEVEDLGDGLKGYTFTILNDDGVWMPYLVEFAFKGAGSATIQQIQFGLWHINDEPTADMANGLGDPPYDKQRDSWVYSGWESVPGVNPLDGGLFTGFLNEPDLFAFAQYTGGDSEYGTGVVMAYIVADGDVTWTGKVYREKTHLIHGTTRIPGDYTGDGMVNTADYTTWADNFNWTGQPVDNPLGTARDVVDQVDYTIWADNFGTVAPAIVPLNVSQQSVPEVTAEPDPEPQTGRKTISRRVINLRRKAAQRRAQLRR